MALVKNVIVWLALVAVIQFWHLLLCQTNTVAVLPDFALVALHHQPYVVWIIVSVKLVLLDKALYLLYISHVVRRRDTG